MLGFGSLTGSSSFGRKKGRGRNKPAALFYLVVGGGGDGGSTLYGTAPGPGAPNDKRGGGGGGAGGVITNEPGQLQGGPNPGASITRPDITEVSGTWNITIGGSGQPTILTNNTVTGQYFVAYQGGRGFYPGQGFPLLIGSGGGALGGYDASAKPVFGSTLDNRFNGGAGTPGQGFKGGDGLENNPNGGGGGGGGAGSAGGEGSLGAGSPSTGGGGAGRAYSITGTPVIYAAGGGGSGGSDGSTHGGGGAGGSGGIGGDGGVEPATNATNGDANTGSGGGSRRIFGGSGNGGSGIVILKHSNEYDQGVTTGSPTITEVSGNIIYKFTGNGTVTW